MLTIRKIKAFKGGIPSRIHRYEEALSHDRKHSYK